MHKSLDFDYHILETSSKFYPSLMSPLKSFYSPVILTSNQNTIFDRLQADTELRLRARLSSSSVPKIYSSRNKSPIEDILIRKGKERDVRLRALIEKEERKKMSELQDKPAINAISKNIMKKKTDNIGRGHILGLSEEKSEKNVDFSKNQEKVVNVEDLKTRKKFNDFERPKNGSKPAETSERITKNQKKLIQELEANYKLLNSSKNSLKSSKSRKYIPNFSKPIDINKLLKYKDFKQKTKESKQKTKEFYSSSNPNLLTINKKQQKPFVRKISECTVNIFDAYSYQQILQNRMMKEIEKLEKLVKE